MFSIFQKYWKREQLARYAEIFQILTGNYRSTDFPSGISRIVSWKIPFSNFNTFRILWKLS